MRLSSLAALACLACLSMGCRGQGRPPLFSPGPAQYQRQQAHHFDPYPDNEMGPAMADVRPRDFQKPSAEPTRGRWAEWGWPRFGFNK